MSLATSALAKGALGGPGLGVIGAGAAAAGALANGAEKQKGWFVPDGFEAVRTRFGRAVHKNNMPVVHKAGFHPTFPFSHSNKFVSVQNRTTDLGILPIERSNILTSVNAKAIWGVKDSHKAWLKIKEGELDQNFVAICGNGLRIVMSALPMDFLVPLENQDLVNGFHGFEPNDGDELSESQLAISEHLTRMKKLVQAIHFNTSSVCAEELDDIGIEIRGIKIHGDTPHPIEKLSAANIGPALGAIALDHIPLEQPHLVTALGIIPLASA